ncbi:hypothetical protein BDY24DRAFT_392390 [Mrakia frigida]|uniref:uncharacterized protein n=1 Tax=Mrakia frigida TaxID=29902 RepID=UPI003FCC10CF
MSTLPTSSSCTQEKTLNHPIEFKITHPAQKYARRIQFSSPPTFSILSAKIVSLWPSCTLRTSSSSSSIGLDYVDQEGDRVLLSSDEELQAFYQDEAGGGKKKGMPLIKMRVALLKKDREEEGLGRGRNVELNEDQENQSRPSGSQTSSISVPPEVEHDASDMPELVPVFFSNGKAKLVTPRVVTPSVSSPPDPVTGGPPCRGFSHNNTQSQHDHSTELEVARSFLAITRDLHPKEGSTSIHEESNVASEGNLVETTRPTPSNSSSTSQPPSTVDVEMVSDHPLEKPKETAAVVESTPTVASLSTLNDNSLSSSPPAPSLLHDLTEAFTLFTASPAFKVILDHVAQGYYTSPSVEHTSVVVDQTEQVDPVSSEPEEQSDPIPVDPSSSAKEREKTNPTERAPSIVEFCQAEVTKGMGEAKRGFEEAGSIFGGMASALTSGVKELLVLKQTRNVKERELREAAEAVEKETKVVVKNENEIGPVVVESNIGQDSTSSEASVGYPAEEEKRKLLALLAENERPLARFGEQSVVGSRFPVHRQAPPGGGFARFAPSLSTSDQQHRSSFSLPSNEAFGSLLAQR